MLTGRPPARNTVGAVVEEAFEDQRLAPVADLLRTMLTLDPGQRPAAAEVVKTLEGN